MNLFEVSGKLMMETPSGELKQFKKTLLVEGVTFTDVECVFLKWMEDQSDYHESMDIESIKKVKIEKVYSTSDDNDVSRKASWVELEPIENKTQFWELTSQTEILSERGVPKYIKEKYIVPAKSQKSAIEFLERLISGSTTDSKIVNGKQTNYASVLLSTENTLDTNY